MDGALIGPSSCPSTCSTKSWGRCHVVDFTATGTDSRVGCKTRDAGCDEGVAQQQAPLHDSPICFCRRYQRHRTAVSDAQSGRVPVRERLLVHSVFKVGF